LLSFFRSFKNSHIRLISETFPLIWRLTGLQRIRSFGLEHRMNDEGHERDVRGLFSSTAIDCQRHNAHGPTRTLV
jgi:hypothetical protein